MHGKLTKRHHLERTNEPLGLIHTDLRDLKYTQTKVGKTYFVIFKDNCTKYCYVNLLRSNYENLDIFKEFKLEVENQVKTTIKIVRSKREGEYDGHFDELCKEHGIVHQTTTPYSLECNGV